MTRINPSIFLKRMVVQKRGRIAYDESFSVGVNAICGSNSSGKSTIMDLIFHVLGGDLQTLTSEALSCDRVLSELDVSGNVVCIARDIEVAGQPPTMIFEGNLDEGLSDLQNWIRFGQRSTTERRSFSQEMYRLMGFPEFRDETASLITMHQLLRLIYSDQQSSVERIFRDDPFERGSKRQAIGDLLLGVDDLGILAKQEEIRVIDRDIGKLQGHLEGLFKILGSTDIEFSEQALRHQLESIDDDEAAIEIQLADVEHGAKAEPEATEVQRTIETMQKLRNSRDELASSLEEIQVQIEDSVIFAESIRARINALEQSKTTVEWLGGLSFEYCPSCLAVLEPQDGSVCHVCKTPISASDASGGHTRLYTELSFQLRETESLVVGRQEEETLVAADLGNTRTELASLERQYRALIGGVDPLEAEQKMLSSRMGYLKRQREDVLRQLETAAAVNVRLDKKANLEAQRSTIRSEVEQMKALRDQRQRELASRISDIAVSILHDDLPVEEKFLNAETFEFNFEENLMMVDGSRSVSMSSKTILKNTLSLAILLLSCEDNLVRFPRILLMDNIEDKGMNQDRSQNFQRVILRNSENLGDIDHQIIFSTSMAAEEVVENYLVGSFHTAESKSLLVG